MSNTPEHCGATPSIDDHIRQAMDLMRRGARMRLSDIPNDPSFLSSNFGSDVSIEIAGRLSAKPANESNVKPLNWLYGQRAGLEAWVTDDYEIVLCTDGLYSLYRRHVLMCRHDMLYKVRDAAQEDHETRIRAALQSAADTPAPPYAHRRGILADLLKLVEAMPRTDRGFSWESHDWQGNEAIRAYGENAKVLKFILDNTDQVAAELRASVPATAAAPLPPSKVREE